MQHQTVPQTTVDLSHAGVDSILAALASAGLTAFDNDTDGHTYVEVWLTDLDTERGPTILSWLETTGWRLQSFAKPEDYGDNKPARTWPITVGSLAEVARDVAAILAESAEVSAPTSGDLIATAKTERPVGDLWTVSGEHGRVSYDQFANRIELHDAYGDIESMGKRWSDEVREVVEAGDDDAVFAALRGLYRTELAGDAR